MSSDASLHIFGASWHFFATFLELSLLLLLFLHGLPLALHADFLDGIAYDLNRVEAVDGNSYIGKYFSNNGIHYIGMVHRDLYDRLSQLFWYLHQDSNDVANLKALHISNEGVLFAMPILIGQEYIYDMVYGGLVYAQVRSHILHKQVPVLCMIQL